MESACCPTPVTEEVLRTKFHTSLNVSNLERSLAFYRLLFGLEPAKQRCDYAKFELNDPPLVLALMPGRPVLGGILNHFGLRVGSAEVLIEIQQRLEVAGIRTKREEGVECCSVRQTKFWVADPDQAYWEIYVVHEELGEPDDDDHAPATEPRDAPASASSPRLVWRHHLGEPVPTTMPQEDNALHEVHFEGTANSRPTGASLVGLFTEAFRVLRPGGEVQLHGLSGDAPLTESLPPFTGPAAAVEHVPAHAEIVRALLHAGFINVQLEKLSSTAHFIVGQVPLREIRLRGSKPGHRPKTLSHSAIYLGPLAQVTDDFGNIFRRGECTSLNVHDWQVLSKSSAAGAFLLL